MHTFAWLDRAQRGARVAADGTLEFGVQRTMLLHLLSVSGEGVWEGRGRSRVSVWSVVNFGRGCSLADEFDHGLSLLE